MIFFFSSRRRHTICSRDWSSDVCSSDLQTHVPRQSSHFLCHAPAAFGFEHADGETAKPRDVFRAVTGADATAVFIIVPVDDVVTTVLNRPVTAVDFENLMRAGLLGGSDW